MIILRQKFYSRRDELPSPRFDDIPEEWAGKFDSIRYNVRDNGKKYSNDMSQLGSIDKAKVKALRKDLKAGYLYEDGPAGGDTHYLSDFSNKGKHWMSKSINTSDRMNYIIYPPELDEKKREIVIKAVIQSLLGHLGPGQKEYSEKQD